MILLDTHVVIWLAFHGDRLSRKAKAAIDEAREAAVPLAISDMTLLELARLAHKNRFRVDISVESFVQEVESRFVVLPMTARICARAVNLPEDYPKDPTDRVIGATALVEGLLLVTADEQIRKSKAVRTIW